MVEGSDEAAVRAACHVVEGGVRLVIVVKPRARQEGVEAATGGLVVRVRAPPVEGAANARVVEVLADALGLPPRAVSLVRGSTSRHKQVVCTGLSFEEAVARLVRACG